METVARQPPAALLALRQQIDGLASAFDGALSLTEQLADDPEARDYPDLLREAQGLLQAAKKKRSRHYQRQRPLLPQRPGRRWSHRRRQLTRIGMPP